MQQILDVWGEGRIIDASTQTPLITGFPDSYNINKIGQRISNGPKQGQTLPGTVYLYDPNKFDRRTFEAGAHDFGISLLGRFHPSELEPPFIEISMLAAYVYVSAPTPLPRPQAPN